MRGKLIFILILSILLVGVVNAEEIWNQFSQTADSSASVNWLGGSGGTIWAFINGSQILQSANKIALNLTCPDNGDTNITATFCKRFEDNEFSLDCDNSTRINITKGGIHNFTCPDSTWLLTDNLTIDFNSGNNYIYSRTVSPGEFRGSYMRWAGTIGDFNGGLNDGGVIAHQVNPDGATITSPHNVADVFNILLGLAIPSPIFVDPTPSDESFNNTFQTIKIDCSGNLINLWFDENADPTTQRLTNSVIETWTMIGITTGIFKYKAGCRNDTLGENSVNSSIRTFTFDLISPNITQNITDNILVLEYVNISMNYSDNLNLSKFNVTLDGILIQETLTNRSFHPANFSFFMGNNVSGMHNFTTYVCDAALNCQNKTIILFKYNLSINFEDFVVYNNTNYTRNLKYVLDYHFPDVGDLSMFVFVNNTLDNFVNINGSNITLNISRITSHSKDEFINISILINSTTNQGLFKRFIIINQTFFNDATNPTIIILNISNIKPFNQTTLNTSMNCSDISGVNLTYNITHNGILLFFANVTNGTRITNETEVTRGLNNLTGRCSDLFGTTEVTLSTNIFTALLALIDERENVAFNLDNVSSAIVFFDNNRSSFDFKQHNTSSINFTGVGDSRLRFEFVYFEGVTIIRYIDLSLLKESDVRVCINEEGITHFQQLIISATNKRAILKSIFSDCYIVADFTRFAFGSTFVLQAFTISTFYQLTTIDNSGNEVLLASLDGSIASNINLDNLEFDRTKISVSISSDALTFKKLEGTETINIRYENLAEDNLKTTMTIIRLDTNQQVFQSSDFADPNDITVLFDFSTLSNVTNSTLFQIEIEREKASGTSSFKKYFNILAKSGILKSQFAFVISILITVFGLTFTISKLALGWFGILIELASIIFLTLAVSTFYTILLQSINAVILIYIVIMLVKDTHTAIT